jgi:xylulokinase
MSLLGLDIGTTGCKAVAVRGDGEILAKAGCEYQLNAPQPGWVELQAEAVWQAVQQVLREVAASTRNDPVEAISVSAMSDTFTPFDRHLQPIYPSIVSFDARSTAEAKTFGDRLGREWLFQTTGMPLHSTHTATKILWLKNHQPDIFKRTRWFLCYEDYILAKLGAEPTISYSNAARMMLFDLNQLAWHSSLLEICGITASQLAGPVQSGVVIGQLNRQLTAELGMSRRVKLVSGGHDQPCAALGCAIVAEGMALDTTGTVEVLLVAFKQPIFDPAMLAGFLCCYPHVYPHRYCSFAQLQGAGAAFRWFRDHLGQTDISEAQTTGRDPYDLIVSKMPARPTNILVVPHLAGSGTPSMDPAAKGSIYGLTLGTDKYELGRAFLEGITYELRINIDLLESVGIKIDTLTAVGGGAKSDFWLQLKADITGRAILANRRMTEASAIGAAILAGYGTGAFATLEEGMQAMSSPGQTFYPNAEWHQRYTKKFNRYLLFRENVSELHGLI